MTKKKPPTPKKEDPKKDRRAELLREAEEQLKSADAGSIAAISALRLLTELEGFRTAPAPPLPKTRIPRTRLEHVEVLLRSAQANRLAAESKASFIAASRYLQLERELLTEYDQLRREKEAEDIANRDEERIISDFEADYSRLPKSIKARIRAIVEAS